MSDSADNKNGAALSKVLGLIALFFSLPREVTTLAHEVISIAVVALSVNTARSYYEETKVDVIISITAILLQVILIIYKTSVFRRNKDKFLGQNPTYKEIDILT